MNPIKTYIKISPNVDVEQREDFLFLKSLKELQHHNLNSFIGMCLDYKGRVLVLWSCCSKGALTDIIFNDEIKLDMIFKSSILKDIIRGLQYLHQSAIGFHGSLNTNNCLVDSHWSVKLTDFGVTKFLNEWIKNNDLAPKEIIAASTLYHMAPEILAHVDLNEGIIDIAPTPASDIYSFGMLMYQILFREGLFETEIVSSTEIIEQLIGSEGLPPLHPIVPQGSEKDYGAHIITLMKLCWAEKPEDRPSLNLLRNTIMTNFAKYSDNVVDHMVKMMQSYAENLEQMVASKTKELYEERQRADELLSRMLPKSVGDRLKNGLNVAPETYESVTLFFSDIVGFTNLCSTSTPLQIVKMLNELYSMFDSTIALFDAYKVETIGDAYLVASGLPNRNGDQHVFEVGNLALAMIKGSANFQIPHRSYQNISIRIGIHTGPVATGVVGLTMPRYCLFGDTVNVAARMESSGEAMKIHISESTRDYLITSKHFNIVYRGQIMLKGKGLKETYWLESNTEEKIGRHQN